MSLEIHKQFSTVESEVVLMQDAMENYRREGEREENKRRRGKREEEGENREKLGEDYQFLFIKELSLLHRKVPFITEKWIKLMFCFEGSFN